MTETVTEPNRALKTVVIVLGALIVICVGVILTTIAVRAGATAEGTAVAAMVPPPAEPMPGHPVFFGDVRVIIPSGTQVQEMSIAGDRLFLLLEDKDGKRRIHTADAASGIYLGTYLLTPEDQAGP